MSTIDEVLRANDSYAQNFTLGHLPLPPARKLAIVACMERQTDGGSNAGAENRRCPHYP